MARRYSSYRVAVIKTNNTVDDGVLYCSVGCATLPLSPFGSDLVDCRNPAVIQLPYPTISVTGNHYTICQKPMYGRCGSGASRLVAPRTSGQSGEISIRDIGPLRSSLKRQDHQRAHCETLCSAYGGALAFNNGDRQPENTYIVIFLQ